MKTHRYSPSYASARRLQDGGMLLDHNELSPRVADDRKTLIIQNADPYLPAKVIEHCADVRYIIPICLKSEILGGVIVSAWYFCSPWGHNIQWNIPPEQAVPPRDRASYRDLFDSPLSEVLEERRPIGQGERVVGILSGIAHDQSAPKMDRSERMVTGGLVLIDAKGFAHKQSIQFFVEYKEYIATVHPKWRSVTEDDAVV